VLSAFAGLLDALGGAFGTGEDLGTTPEDMAFLGTHTKYVHGIDTASGAARDPGPYTARGVFAAIRAALQHRLGSPEITGRTAIVQGAGDVGAPLARRLAEEGANVIVADVDEVRARSVADEIGGAVIDPGRAYETECDVFAPCAVGQVLSSTTVSRLRCSVVVGSANNQLKSEEDGDALHAREILLAPDFLANGGGAIAFGSMSLGVDDPDEIASRIDAIEDRMLAVFSESRESGEAPFRVLTRQVRATLAEARALRGRDVRED
jgi:leucine dehydrogenase